MSKQKRIYAKVLNIFDTLQAMGERDMGDLSQSQAAAFHAITDATRVFLNTNNAPRKPTRKISVSLRDIKAAASFETLEHYRWCINQDATQMGSAYPPLVKRWLAIEDRIEQLEHAE